MKFKLWMLLLMAFSIGVCAGTQIRLWREPEYVTIVKHVAHELLAPLHYND